MKTALIIVIALIILIPILFFFMGRGSANGSAPGLVDGRLAVCSSKPNCVSSENSTPDAKKVAAFEGVSLDQAAEAIEAMDGTITRRTESYLSSTFTSSTFKFVDDLEMRVGTDKLHIRSASRSGYSDRGVNRARAEALRTHLKN